MPQLTLVETVSHTLGLEMERDDRIVVLGEDVGYDGGIFRATDGLIERFGEDRVRDTPLAESAIIGASIGLCVNGMIPVPELQFSGFSYQAFHQLESHAARYRKRTQGRMTMPMVVRMPYGAGVRALEHHSESQEVYWAHSPGLKVVIPRGPYKTWELLTASLRDPDPVVFMEPKALYRKFREDIPDESPDSVPKLGLTERVQEGDDVTVVAWGHMMWRTQQVVEKLQQDGISVDLLDPQTISPLDSDPIIESVKRTGRCVIVQEAHKTHGLASEIMARIMEEAILHLEAPVKRITGPDIIVPLLAREEAYMPDLGRIEEGIRETTHWA